MVEVVQLELGVAEESGVLGVEAELSLDEAVAARKLDDEVGTTYSVDVGVVVAGWTCENRGIGQPS